MNNIKYRLYKYSGFNDEETICVEDESKEKVVAEAIKLSSKDEGYYGYRMEIIQNRERVIGGWRYFQNGKERTQEWRNAIMSNYT